MHYQEMSLGKQALSHYIYFNLFEHYAEF